MAVSNHDGYAPAVRLRRITPLLLALAVLALFAGCGDDDSDGGGATAEGAGSLAEYDITGTWTGKLTQKDLSDFRVRAEIRNLDDKFKNTVSYTGINCSGHWEFLGRDGAAFLFEEVIDAGKGGNCKGKGNVTLTPFSAGGVDYNFRGGGVESAGVLRRSN
jgi:hypothetical protein